MKVLTVALLVISGASFGFGQATGSVVGSVVDASGARVPAAAVAVSNAASGVHRSAVTNATGAYGFSSLEPGDYEIAVELAGFKRTIKRATVNVGRDITVDFSLETGEIAQTVDVSGGASAINLVDSKVDAIIEQSQISGLPLNGRSAYEMAKLVPGVQVTTGGSRNTEMLISIAGKSSDGTRVSVDGISVDDIQGGGGTAMNFSQEVVREFQVSINNNDPSVGISSSGAVNIVTRSGSNDFHGNLFGFFRDGQYAAFPGLGRPVPKPNPNNDPAIASFNAGQVDPPFWRRQYGGMLSGPILKDRLFWLASVDVTRQVAAVTFDTGSSDLAAFNLIRNYPRTRLLQNYRLDWRATDKHSLFARFSRDGFSSRVSGLSTLPSSYTSWDTTRHNRAYVGTLGWTAVWSPTLVGELRFGLPRWHVTQVAAPEAYQEARLYAPQLPRMGEVTVSGTNLIFGANNASDNNALAVYPQIVSNFTASHGRHTLKFGVSYEGVRFLQSRTLDSPFQVTVFNPTQARQAGISVPSTFLTIGDLLQLPLASLNFGIGPTPTFPFMFNGDGHDILWSHQVYAYLGDSYKVTPRLTLNFSLSYTYDPLPAENRDLPRPASIAPLLDGGKLNAPEVKLNQFSPAFGFAWDPTGGGKTVIRGGFGVYRATGGLGAAANERSQLAPLGDGYAIVPGTFVTNPKTGTGTVSFGSAAANASAGIFRLTDLLTYISGIRDQLTRTVFTGNNQSLAITNFDYLKGNSNAIFASKFSPSYSLQANIGAQRQWGEDWLLDGSFLYNLNDHTQFNWDANRQFRPVSAGGRVIPALGQVLIAESGGRTVYQGLLFSVRKRMTHRFQLTASYTLSRYKSTAATLVDYNVRANNFGYDSANPTQQLTVGATVNLPWGFEIAAISQAQGKPTFNPFLNGLDLNADGTANDRLPGLALNSVNRDAGASDLTMLVTQFNQTYAGKRDARGTLIQPVTLRPNFGTGDGLLTQDVRLSKKINIGERVNLNLIGEVFNIFNIANVTYVNSAGNLYGSGFGQPSARVGQLFGSGGPRAFQFAARVSF